MARDAVPITTLNLNAGTDEPSGTTINPANGASVAAGGDTRKLVIRVTNTHTAPHTLTLRAGVNPPAFRKGLGDAAVTVAADGGVTYMTVESARFIQSDGSIWVDFETGMTGKVMAFRLPDQL